MKSGMKPTVKSEGTSPTNYEEDTYAERSTIFKDYNLNELNVPDEALPVHGKDYKGSHSYTINLKQGAATQHP